MNIFRYKVDNKATTMVLIATYTITSSEKNIQNYLEDIKELCKFAANFKKKKINPSTIYKENIIIEPSINFNKAQGRLIIEAPEGYYIEIEKSWKLHYEYSTLFSTLKHIDYEYNRI